jgi:hypothetical protein
VVFIDDYCDWQFGIKSTYLPPSATLSRLQPEYFQISSAGGKPKHWLRLRSADQDLGLTAQRYLQRSCPSFPPRIA